MVLPPGRASTMIGWPQLSVRLGGTLGPDLAAAYARYQDKAMAAVLTRECIPRARSPVGALPLTVQEAFAIRAFLRQTMQTSK